MGPSDWDSIAFGVPCFFTEPNRSTVWFESFWGDSINHVNE